MVRILTTHDNYQGVKRFEYDTTYILLKYGKHFVMANLVALIRITRRGGAI